MEVVTIKQDPPALRAPVLVAAFQGWNDAGEAASGAAATLVRELGATGFADIDPEEFFDFQATRPTVSIDKAGQRALHWPENAFAWAPLPGTDRDVVVLTGTEPNLRWRTFASGIVALAEELGIELVVTLGALQADLPHTRPVPVTGTTSDGRLAGTLGLRASRYQGPTGITGVLHQACDQAGMPTASLWAGVPHYLAATPYVAGALALCERAVAVLGADVSLERLAKEALRQADDVAELVAADEDLAEYVADLESRADEPDFDLALADTADLPHPTVTGDELAAELERYLRDRNDP